MRFELIDAAKKEFPVQRVCKVLDVSASGYFASGRVVLLAVASATTWCRSPMSARPVGIAHEHSIAARCVTALPAGGRGTGCHLSRRVGPALRAARRRRAGGSMVVPCDVRMPGHPGRKLSYRLGHLRRWRISYDRITRIARPCSRPDAQLPRHGGWVQSGILSAAGPVSLWHHPDQSQTPDSIASTAAPTRSGRCARNGATA